MTDSDKVRKSSGPGGNRTLNLRIRSLLDSRFPRISCAFPPVFVPSGKRVSFVSALSVHTVSRRWMRFWMQNPGGAA
jgi:hypothetical protein